MAVHPAVRQPEKPRRNPSSQRQKARLEPFRVEAHDFGFDSRIDLDKLNQLVDELEAVELLKKLGS